MTYKTSALRARLLAAATAEASGTPLPALLAALSVADRRAAHRLLAEDILPGLDAERFWMLFEQTVPTDSRAFLGTFLRAAERGLRGRTLSVDFTALSRFGKGETPATPIDRRKTLEALLPLLSTPEQVRSLIDCFPPMSLRELVSAAFASPRAKAGQRTEPTLQALFVLFSLMREEDEPALLRPVLLDLIRQNTPRAYRLAAIAQQYFGLTDIPCTFSLRIAHYELSRLDCGYDYFCRLMQ